MARRTKNYREGSFKGNGKKRTSIGNSVRSRPKNKHKKKSHKKYKGQGK